MGKKKSLCIFTLLACTVALRAQLLLRTFLPFAHVVSICTFCRIAVRWALRATIQMSEFQNHCYDRTIISLHLPWRQPTLEHLWMEACSVYQERERAIGLREECGRALEHRIYRTGGGDFKLEVRNNWCNAGKWRRDLAGGADGSESVRPPQCSAVGEHQSRAHLAAMAAVRLQRDGVFTEQGRQEASLQRRTPRTTPYHSIINSYYWRPVCFAVNTIILLSVP